MKRRIVSALIATTLVVGILAGCGSSSEEESEESKGTVVIGIDTMTETGITSEIYALALEDAGYTVERQDGLELAHDALVAGDIDMWTAYTGSLYTRYMENEPIYDSDEMTQIVRDYYAETYDIAELEPTAVNNSYGIAMLKERAEELGISTFQDLQEKADQVVWGDWGFLAMPTTGRVRIEELYGPFDFKEVIDISMDLSYDMLRNGDVDVIPVCTTDAQLAEDDILQLDSEQDVWCAYLLVPLVRQEVLDEYPEVEDILNNVSSKLDIDTMLPLIVKVSIDHEDINDVAAEFYEETFK